MNTTTNKIDKCIDFIKDVFSNMLIKKTEDENLIFQQTINVLTSLKASHKNKCII